MAMNTSTYAEIRSSMRPGDVVAFSGKGDFSQIIKWATRSNVSHVGVILQSQMLIDDEAQKGYFNQIIESTSLNGFSGVSISRLSDRVATYDGEMWWLPISDQTRQQMDNGKFYNWLLHQEHKEYDAAQAVKSALDVLDKVPVVGRVTHNTEDFARFFCSELVAAALEHAGAIASLNASEVTPNDLCRFAIYSDDYYQLKGDTKPIRAYNSLSPEGWGE